MNILFVHERFIFRYGVDRVLISLASEFVKLGHSVGFMGYKFDQDHFDYPGLTFEIPYNEKKDNYLDLDSITTDWLKNNWNKISKKFNPDFVINGGWPFYSSISFFNKLKINCGFIDCGVVPQTGMEEFSIKVNNLILTLRQNHLFKSKYIFPISNFLANSYGNYSICKYAKVIHLAVDDTFSNNINIVSSFKNSNNYLKILCLGRWEQNNYKNSHAVLKVLKYLIKKINIKLIVLAEESEVDCEEKLKEHIIFAGHPSDEELVRLMQSSDLGISTSLWEGFNLPMAEMQCVGKPVFAFNVGAHPEVIIHPWFLSESENELSDKILSIVKDISLLEKVFSPRLEDYISSHRWKTIAKKYLSVINASLINNKTKSTNKLEIIYQTDDYYPHQLIVDVTNSTRDSANSGVIRVSRKLSATLQKYTNPIFAVYDDHLKTYVFPTRDEYETLSSFNGPLYLNKEFLSTSFDNRRTLEDNLYFRNNQNKVLLLTETTLSSRVSSILKFTSDNNIKLASLFYDAIPITHPEYVQDLVIKNNHSQYMLWLAKNHLVIPISEHSKSDLLNFWKTNLVISTPKVHSIYLPADFSLTKANKTEKSKTILCVSTLEPRKNHLRLLKAYVRVIHKHPDWKLILVGNKYAGAEELAAKVEKYCHQYPQIQWRGVVNDTELTALYTSCSFTIYPSLVEGYGLPIIESLYYSKPCICSKTGVMGEIARDGGCLSINVESVDEIELSILKLISDRNLYGKLVNESNNRVFSTWEDYSRNILDLIRSSFPIEFQSVRPEIIDEFQLYKKNMLHQSYPTITEILYPNCIFDNWQMNESERIGLTGVLSRINPKLAIEVGTFKAGSLSLIKQFSSRVISIDIDPEVTIKYSHLGDNVQFLTGDSKEILPELLSQINEYSLPLNFILIDGDHSFDGVAGDVSNIINYHPRFPLIVMCHDSFNPNCRRALVNAEWQKSPYVSFVDIDFIPGRIIEHDGEGSGELWGGLSLIYLSPRKRQSDLIITQSAEKMQKKLAKYLNEDINCK